MNWLKQLLGIGNQQCSKSQRVLDLDIQRLEDRIYLAGNVDVTFNDRTGDLFVRADSASNRIEISANEAGRIVVKGLARGGSRTTINDSGTEFVVGPTRNGVIPDDLLIFTRPGNDFIELNGITVNDDIRIIGGGQNDSYLLTDVESGGRLFATGGGGDDHILVQGSRFVETTMITGGGQDFVGWVDSRLPGRGRYILGTGLDGFVMADSAIAGEVYLNTGPQEDAVYFNNTTIRTELDVLLGSFDDTLVFAEGSTLPGDTVIRPLGVRNADKLVMDESVRVRNDIIDSFGNSFVEDNDVLGRFELAVGLPVDFLVDTFKARGFSQADFPLDIPADDYATYYPNAERWQFSSELHGEIERGYDFDWQLVRLNQGERYTFETFAGTLDKTRLQLYDRDGVQVAIDSDGGVGKLSKLTYRATYTGVYYLGVSSNVDFVGTYTVRRV